MTSRIYKRETIPSGGSDKKAKENRTRKRIINFRTTEEEGKIIDKRIELSGLSRQEFFVTSCMHQPINVIGNIKTFDAIRKEMRAIDEHIRAVETTDQIDMDKLESLRTILEILDSFYKNNK